MKTIQVGIIGTGFSASFHIESLRRVPGVEIVAIAGRTLERAQETAKALNVPIAYGDYRELIADPAIEVVHNCTPNQLHYDINVAAMKAGKHLLSEKPLAVNHEQSSKLAQMAEEMNLVTGVCLNYRHFPLVVQARSLMQKGQYGQPYLVTGSYLQDWLLYKTDYSWRLEPDMNGPSRAIADIGSHWCDTVQFVLSRRIVAVMADLHTVHPRRSKPVGGITTFGRRAEELTEELEITTEDFGSVLVEFEDRTRGAFTVSQVSAGRKNRLCFEISAADASLYWNQESPNTLWLGRRNAANRELMRDPELLSPDAAAITHLPGGHQEGWSDGMKNMLVDFYSEVRRHGGEAVEGTPSFATFQDGHHLMRIIDAILESSEKKSWIRL